ncbi:MAG TPA: 3-dehydroquinate synthase [Syntrophomonas sp.]|nr:3-dehydroquinate synthase [Syntrophomonas sp.]
MKGEVVCSGDTKEPSPCVRVELAENSYDIHIGEKCLDRLPQLLTGVDHDSVSMLVSDQLVFSLYGERTMALLGAAGWKIEPAVIKGGEECKNLTTLEWLYERMINAGMDRHSTVFALGGGVTGDLAGFAAASYMRGVGYIQLPTSLLAQVDSSVGGKTGVNLPLGKNLVGAFYQPGLVLADVDLLHTLAEKEYQTGLAEVIKYGIIWDREFFEYLETNAANIKRRDTNCLIHMVRRCCEIKAEIVSQDEKETGLRALLNLGHTFGHAFEALTDYRQFTHGEAVAIGMICAARLSARLGMMTDNEAGRVAALIDSYGLPTTYGDLAAADIIDRMRLDKKNAAGKIKLVLPAGIGRSQVIGSVTEEQIKSVLS